ncbi:hypothetical protein [Streptomyces sp. NPDC007905]|uniref:hypothetical protein n=1 Tax=Streptomyces sp. NPDC007905 TaxID=3364788 RepID=UPI0036F0A3B1
MERLLIITAAALWGCGTGMLIPRPAYRLSVPSEEPWRSACPAGHPSDMTDEEWAAVCDQLPGAAPPRAKQAVLMVNPIPAKGADLLNRLIRHMLEQRFTLVEGWWSTAEQFAGYPNATHARPVSVPADAPSQRSAASLR